MCQPRLIAVVTAHNDERTVGDVLDSLQGRVDDFVVVDDGSTDGTGREIERAVAGRAGTRVLTHEFEQGLSEAYHLAFSHLGRRVESGDLSPDDLVCTVSAGGQHPLSVLEDLRTQMTDDQLDALLARRDLSGAPAPTRVAIRTLGAWASLWSGGVRLHDVASGYRLFRLGALLDAQDYYHGYRYSEAVEAAIVLCRLGYEVRNDAVVPATTFRSRRHMGAFAADLAAIPGAAIRVTLKRPGSKAVPSLLPPVAVSLALAAAGGVATAVVLRRSGRRRVSPA